jgi:carbon catabolite-derepressing protein kinase
MDLQLYQIDDETYIVDFKHQGYYKASTEPGASKFDRAVSPLQSEESSLKSSSNAADGRCGHEDEHEEAIVSPFLFMDTACRLILLLAGDGDSAPTNGPAGQTS